MSIAMILAGIAGVLAILWGRATLKNVKAERDSIREVHEAINAAGRRLEAARQANQKPINPKQRNDFEGQP